MKGRARSADDPVREEWSAGGIVFRLIGDETHVLLILDPYGRWGLPKGHIEEGEEPQGAALREVREETGLEELILGPEVGAIDWHFRQGGRAVHKHCRFFLMGSPRGEPVPEVEEGIRDCRWLPLGPAIRTLGYDNAREILRNAHAMLEGTDRGRPPWLVWEESGRG